jgi:hypothetical protein
MVAISLLALLIGLTSCSWQREDVGPYQGSQRTYPLNSFDRIDMGSAFIITVQQGATFGVTVEGDRRNLDDLDVYVQNGILHAQYRNSRRREYQTSFVITMPTLRGVEFSGASRSTITGFSNLSDLYITLSGASESQFLGLANRLVVDLSGASNLHLTGSGTALAAELSGASLLQGFGYPVNDMTVHASGASKANVSAANTLDVDASGASVVRYRGGPVVRQRLSGASVLQNE